MNFAGQIVTVAAVVTGALTTYLVTALGDRARYHREIARQWTDRKLESYTCYASDIKNLVTITRQITALHGLHEAAPGIDEEKAIALLDEAEVRRSASYETVRLIGDAETIRATRALNDAAHRLEWIARGKLEADPDGWERSWQLYLEAVDAFHRNVRQELDVPGQFLPRSGARGGWAPPSLPANDSAAGALGPSPEE